MVTTAAICSRIRSHVFSYIPESAVDRIVTDFFFLFFPSPQLHVVLEAGSHDHLVIRFAPLDISLSSSLIVPNLYLPVTCKIYSPITLMIPCDLHCLLAPSSCSKQIYMLITTFYCWRTHLNYAHVGGLAFYPFYHYSLKHGTVAK